MRAYFVSINSLSGPECANIHGSMMDVWQHHLGAISSPSRPCSLSVTSPAADGGRLVKGWALVNRAVKCNNISALFKTAKRFTC